MSNAFTIPKQSVFVKNKGQPFSRKPQFYHQNMPQIVLPGSYKNVPPTMQRKPREKPKQSATQKSCSGS